MCVCSQIHVCGCVHMCGCRCVGGVDVCSHSPLQEVGTYATPWDMYDTYQALQKPESLGNFSDLQLYLCLACGSPRKVS